MKSPDIATTLIAITFIICCTLLSLKGCNRNVGDELIKACGESCKENMESYDLDNDICKCK